MEKTKIQWADHSWSPWRGCTKVSPGCANCYAETLAKRNPVVLGGWGRGATRVLAKNWNDPVRWNRRQAERSCPRCDFDEAEGDLVAQCESCQQRPRVFPSLCDWLDDEVPIVWLGRFLHLIDLTPHLEWLLLTKRPELFRARMSKLSQAELPWAIYGRRWVDGEYPANVWFGVSVEDQERADKRIPLLLDIPACLRWLSVEPLLGPVDFRAVPGFNRSGSAGVEMLRSFWVVVGGESGHRARPCNVEWIRSIAHRCKTAGVPLFVKQLGAAPFWNGMNGSVPTATGQRMTLADAKGGDPAEWPEDLRIREFPEVKS